MAVTKVLRPLYLLGSDDVTPEEELLTETSEQCENLAQQIPESNAQARNLRPLILSLSTGLIRYKHAQAMGIWL